MTDNRPKMLIIDGSSVLTTCYYANLPTEVKRAKTEEEKELYYGEILQTSEGIYTNGILGFIKIFTRWLKDWNPDYVVIAFDKSRKTTFRKQMYADYKGHRSKTPKPLSNQILLIQELLADCHIPVLLSNLYEADDLAGSVAEKYKESMQVRLITKDRDYLQLVDDTYDVKCMIMTDDATAKQFREDYGIPVPDEYCYRNIMEFTEHRVKSEKGVMPESIVDLKALAGDTSDNIPGVKGISSTTAGTLLNHYGTIEKLYDTIHADTSKKALKELSESWKDELGLKRSPVNALIAGEESAYLSKKLAAIKRDIPLPDLTAFPTSSINQDQFLYWMQQLELNTQLLG